MTEEFDRRAAAHEMLVEEYKQHYGEMQQTIKMANDTERYGFIAIAAIYTWLLAPPSSLAANTVILYHATLVPFCVACVVLLRIKGCVKDEQETRAHLRSIEDHVYLPALGEGAPYDVDEARRKLRAGLFIEPVKASWHERLRLSRTWLIISFVSGLIALAAEILHAGETWNLVKPLLTHLP